MVRLTALFVRRLVANLFKKTLAIKKFSLQVVVVVVVVDVDET